MSNKLSEQIGKRGEFASPHEEAMLNVLRTASHLSGSEHAFFKRYNLSSASYNLLRIVRGHHQAGECMGVRASLIGCEMVVRMPDVTRLVDRLESLGLVSRHVDEHDRRVKFVAITAKGLALLGELDPLVDRMVKEQLGHMSSKELTKLSRLLERARNEDANLTHKCSTQAPR